MLHNAQLSPELLRQIADTIAGVRFGHVQITIHDARVVQIEKAEKIRVESSAHLTAGGASEHRSREDRTSGTPRLMPGR